MSVVRGSDVIAGLPIVDGSLNTTSTRAIQNQAVANAVNTLNARIDTIVGGDVYTKTEIDSLSNNLVHKTGTETISGSKTYSGANTHSGTNTFTGLQNLKGSGWRMQIYNTEVATNTTAPTALKGNAIAFLANNGSKYAVVEHSINANSQTHGIYFNLYNGNTASWSTGLGVWNDNSGSTWTQAPTMSLNAVGNEIVTAGSLRNLVKNWCNSISNIRSFDQLYAGPTGSGTLNLNAAYTNYGFLLVAGGSDSQTNIKTLLIPTYEITHARGYGSTWTLWYGGYNCYWICAASSTTTSFTSSSENSVIMGIWGINF